MTSIQKQAQDKRNAKLIAQFFKAHSAQGWYFSVVSFCPVNDNIPSSRYDLANLQAAQDQANMSAVRTTGWIIKTETVSIQPAGDILTINTIHPKHLGQTPEKVSHQVQIIASNAVCSHGQRLGWVDNENMPICGGCGADLDTQMLAYELGQEAAQNERLYA